MLIIKIILWILGIIVTILIIFGIFSIIGNIIVLENEYIDDIFDKITEKVKKYFRRG